MQKILGIGAVVLGVVGALLSAVAIGLGCRMAASTVDRIDRIAARFDEGLAEMDERLARVESRVSTVRTELNEVRGGAEAIIAENPELPRVRAEFERLLDRLIPALGRLEATADSLQAVATGLRGAADLVAQLNDDPEATVRVRYAADTIDRAAEALDAPQARVDAVKSAKAVQLTQKLVSLTRDSIASSDLLAEGLAAARMQIPVARKGTTEYRDKVVVRIYAATVAHTFFWLWVALGQLCLIGWGRRRISNRVAAIS